MNSFSIFVIIIFITSILLIYLFIKKYLYYFRLKSIKLNYLNYLRIIKYLKTSQNIKVFLEKINNIEYLKKFEEINNILLNNSITIGVIGDQKSGKSSLINAIIKTKLLPEGVTPVNNCLIEIKHGLEVNVNVKFNNGNVKNIIQEEIKHYCDENINTNNHKDVNLVSIEYPLSNLKESIVLVDTPGINSIYSYHTSITNNFIINSPILIYVISLEYPISKKQQEFIEKLLTLNIVKIYYVFSKKDLVKNDYDKIFDFNKKEILKLNGNENQSEEIISVSSKDFFDGLNNNDNKTIANSNIPKIVNNIKQYTSQDYFEIQLIYFKKSILNLLKNLKSDIYNETIEYNKNIVIQMSIANINSELKNIINDSLKIISNTIHYLVYDIEVLLQICESKISDLKTNLITTPKSYEEISCFINQLNNFIIHELDKFYQKCYEPILFNLKIIQTKINNHSELIKTNHDFDFLLNNSINRLSIKPSQKMRFDYYDQELINKIIKSLSLFEKIISFIGFNQHKKNINQFINHLKEKFILEYHENIIVESQIFKNHFIEFKNYGSSPKKLQVF